VIPKIRRDLRHGDTPCRIFFEMNNRRHKKERL